MTGVDELVNEGRLEPVEADREAASVKLSEAKRHLESSAAIAESDPGGAYALLYDAARKAVDAHMVASGYRVMKNRPGAHEASGRYAVLVLGRGGHADDIRAFDRMRRNRNRSEYGVWQVGRTTLETDLAHARGIVRAVERALR